MLGACLCPPHHEDRLRFANEELLGKGNLDLIEQQFSSDDMAHSGSRTHRGRRFVRRFVGLVRTALPDVRVLSVEILARSGSTITWQRSLRGTHRADMLGIPASGKRLTWHELLVSRFEGGKIAEEWLVSDLAGELFAKQPRR